MKKIRVNKKIKADKGSATLESTFVIPVIIILLFSMISLAMFFYNKLVLLDSTTYAVQQSAMNWNNSSKDLETGSLTSNSSDGLYWRILNDFENSPLAQRKIEKTISFLELALGKHLTRVTDEKTDIGYDNNIISRQVLVSSKQTSELKDVFLSKLVNKEVKTSSGSEIVEPVEYIRNLELGVTYLDEFIKYLDFRGESEGDGNDSIILYASIKSDVNGQRLYHYSGCKHIKQIKNENLIIFDSVDEAQRKGFHLCLDCAYSNRDK